MKRPLAPLFLLALLAMGLSGCGKKSNVLATVAGKDVTQAEFDAYMKVKHVSAADAARRDRSLSEYLDRAALASVIEKEKLLEKDAVEAEVEEFRRELLISRYFDRFLDDKVNEGAIKNYYDAHATTYEQRKVHAAHILIRVSPKASAEEKQAKQTTAQGVAAKLGSGESFEELAKTMSEDRISGAKGGDLGWIREGSIDPELSKRAFSMKGGSVSEPFETPFGFHILKVIEEPKTIRKPYAAVVGDIRYQLRNETKDAELKRLKDKVRVTKKNAYKFDPAAAGSAKPNRAPIVPTLPSAETQERDPSPVTRTGASLSPADSGAEPPTVVRGQIEPNSAEKTAKSGDSPAGPQSVPGKPPAPKPVPAKPVAVKPVAPPPPAPVAPPAEAPAPPAEPAPAAP